MYCNSQRDLISTVKSSESLFVSNCRLFGFPQDVMKVTFRCLTGRMNGKESAQAYGIKLNDLVLNSFGVRLLCSCPSIDDHPALE